MLKFYWNGIKENGGKLQRCFFSDADLITYPKGTLTIYAKDYKDFSPGIYEAFKVENASEPGTDYFETSHIRVLPDHPLHALVYAAVLASKARNQIKYGKAA